MTESEATGEAKEEAEMKKVEVESKAEAINFASIKNEANYLCRAGIHAKFATRIGLLVIYEGE